MDSTRQGFVTGGIWCLDRNIAVPHWPKEDMAVTAGRIERAGGGSSCNFAVNIRKLDPSAQVETMGLIGDDADGDFLVSVAESHGIRHSFARTSEAPTQSTDAYHSEATGRRTHILFRGAGDLLSPDHFDLSKTRARFFHLGLPGIHATMDAPWQGDANGWVTVLRQAQAEGLQTNLELVAAEADHIRALALPCLPHLTTLVVNDHEIGAMAGMTTVRDGRPDPETCLAAARDVLAKGAMRLVVVHHTAGACLVARDGTEAEKSAVNVPEAARRGANGAGDAFAAGLFHGLNAGWSHGECLTMAHATAAASLRSASASGAVEDFRSCLALAEAWGWQPPMR